MPIYHFHLYDDEGTSPDWDGVELPDMAAAKRQAAQFAGGTIIDDTILDRCGREWRLEVTNATGAVLFGFAFTLRPAPDAAASTDRPGSPDKPPLIAA